MDNSNLVLSAWKKQIASFDRLSLEEAQELYTKAISTNDKKLLDKVVLGTLYVVISYIERNNLALFCSSSYDMNDIISSFNEIWIKKINRGELLNVDKYSFLFTSTFFEEVYRNLLGDEIIVHEQFGASSKFLIKLFTRYVNLKNKGIEFSCSDLIDDEGNSCYSSCFLEDYSLFVNLFEKIYENLNFDKVENLNINKTKIHNFFKILINIGLFEPLSDALINEIDMEDEIIQNMLFKSFVDDVDSVLTDERYRQIIHQRYGLDDGNPNSLENIAKVHKITRERVRQLEAKALRKLWRNHTIREYNKV